jgi:Tfp pilus assembly protein PilW
MWPVATRRRPTVGRAHGLAQRLRARARSERGTTLIELLVYTVASLFVFSAVITFLLTTFSQQNQTASRVATNNQAEHGLEQLVADLRQAVTSVSISNPTSSTTEIQFGLPTPGTPTSSEQVAWTCPSTGASSVGTCSRALTGSGGTTVTNSEINDVASMTFSALDSNGNALTLPLTNSSSVASIGMTLTVQTSSNAYASSGNSNTPLAGTVAHPIVLQATADLLNFA